jgi:hypothetical protein
MSLRVLAVQGAMGLFFAPLLYLSHVRSCAASAVGFRCTGASPQHAPTTCCWWDVVCMLLSGLLELVSDLFGALWSMTLHGPPTAPLGPVAAASVWVLVSSCPIPLACLLAISQGCHVDQPWCSVLSVWAVFEMLHGMVPTLLLGACLVCAFLWPAFPAKRKGRRSAAVEVATRMLSLLPLRSTVRPASPNPSRPRRDRVNLSGMLVVQQLGQGSHCACHILGRQVT